MKYNLKELRLRVYSEHTFEGGKMDLELQIIHEIDDESKSVLPTTKYGYKLGIAVLFSTSRDKNKNNSILSPKRNYLFFIYFQKII